MGFAFFKNFSKKKGEWGYTRKVGSIQTLFKFVQKFGKGERMDGPKSFYELYEEAMTC